MISSVIDFFHGLVTGKTLRQRADKAPTCHTPARNQIMPLRCTQGLLLTALLIGSATTAFAGACSTTPTNGCLLSDRFAVELLWKDRADNAFSLDPVTRSLDAEVTTWSDDTAYFTVFGPGNVELLVKVIDGRAVNGHFWVFAAGTGNFETELHVSDTQTGAIRIYANPFGVAPAAITDTGAFEDAVIRSDETISVPAQVSAFEPAPNGLCPSVEGAFCLQGGRFEATVDWRDFDDASGSAAATEVIGDESALVSLFSPNNIDVLVKVLDGRARNGRFWVQISAVTNVEFTVTVTDLQTDMTEVFTNPLGVTPVAYNQYEFGLQDSELSIVNAQPNPQIADYGIVVDFAFDGEAPDSGLVTVSDGVGECQAPPEQGSCVLISNAGTNTLVASYSGDENHPPSTSPAYSISLLPPMLPELVSRGQGIDNGYHLPGSGQLQAQQGHRIDDSGEFVVVETNSRLTVGDGNNWTDIYLHNRTTDSDELVSVGPTGVAGNSNSSKPSISGNGRFVVFESRATNLVENDTNGRTDIFVKDLLTNTTELVSYGFDGKQLTRSSMNPTISSDGRYVLFANDQDGIVADDTNGAYDLFLVDRIDDTIIRVSLGSSGEQIEAGVSQSWHSLSPDGRHITFTARGGDIFPGVEIGDSQAYVRDVDGGTTKLVSANTDGVPGNSNSRAGGVSNGGQAVVFESFANNLIADDTEGQSDIFWRDMSSGDVRRLSANDGVGGNGSSLNPVISADGRYVGFVNYSTNLLPSADHEQANIFLFDLQSSTLEHLSPSRDGGSPTGSSFLPSLSLDASVVIYLTSATDIVPGTIATLQSYIEVDRTAGETTSLLPAISNGSLGNGASVIAASSLFGRHVVFATNASNLTSGAPNPYGFESIMLRDRALGITEEISVSTDRQGINIDAFYPAISDDGQWVSFASYGLLDDDTNFEYEIFLRNRKQQTTKRLSESAAGDPPDGRSLQSHVSADGKWVAFDSRATNLVPDDSNGVGDIYLYEIDTETLQRVSLTNAGEQADGESFGPHFSADGEILAFVSAASNLVDGDGNSTNDIFVRDLSNQSNQRITANGVEANDHMYRASPSETGQWVAFDSGASNLVAGDTNDRFDVFVWDMDTGQVERVSVRSDGQEIDGHSFNPDISRNGRYVTFSSVGSNVVDGQFSGYYGIYVHDRESGETVRVDRSATGDIANGYSGQTKFDPSGQVIVFDSFADNLIPTDTNATGDVFLTGNPASEFGGEIRWMNQTLPIDGLLKRGDGFGQAVAIDGDRMVISAWRDDDGGNNVGAAYVFERNGATWQFMAKLVPEGLSTGQRMGRVIALEGDTVVMGNWFANAAGPSSGNAVVFELGDNLQWSQTAVLLPADAASKDAFGTSISIHQQRIVVGAEGRGDFANKAGAVFVYEKSGSSWGMTHLIGADGLGVNDRFGSAVELNGDRLAIGAWGDDDGKDNSGAIYLFEFSGVQWEQSEKLKIDDIGRGDRLGTALALDGDQLLAGVPFADEQGANSGAAYLFEFIDGGWMQSNKLTPAIGSAGDRFATVVAIEQERVLIGAPQNDDEGFNQGAVYLFAKHTPDAWSAAQVWYDSTPNKGDFFGQSIGLSGQFMLIGVPLADGILTNAGSARVGFVD